MSRQFSLTHFPKTTSESPEATSKAGGWCQTRTSCPPDSLVWAELISSLRILFILAPTQLEYSQRPSQRLRSLANRGSGQLLEQVASILWPLQKLLSGDRMLSWGDLPEPPYDTGRAIFLDAQRDHLREGKPGSSPRNAGGERVRKDQFPATDCFLLTLSKLQVIPLPPLRPPSPKRQPRNEGGQKEARTRLGSGGERAIWL